ncbi:MAG: hypothetical protein IGS03_11670 [Candidatus Sericytochromatia bacterium]|nr:hypothetical protein [Candidatus Sericytochromatia bacterium]
MLLILSNGSGEDRIGAEIAQAWRRQRPDDLIQALALVGTGTAYRAAGVELLPPCFSPPSAGFAYLQPRLLWRDLRAGLLPHLQQSCQLLRQHPARRVIAVGDVVPLLASLALPQAAGIQRAFVACALSEYYLGTKRQKGKTVFDPLQRRLLRRFGIPVFARDALTAASLQRFGVDARCVGNLMLDAVGTASEMAPAWPGPVVGLLPGSHHDAPANLALMLAQLAPACQHTLQLVLLQAPQLPAGQLQPVLARAGWTETTRGQWAKAQARLCFWPARHYQTLLHKADLMVGLAGTANEQAVGYGVPVLSFAAAGAAQYTWRFGEAQQRLLGAGLCFLGDPHPQLVSWQLLRMLREPAYRRAAHQSAAERFGQPGGTLRLVQAFELAAQA